MYLSFYKFNCKPFELVPNPEFIFLSKTHKKAITYLDYGIRERVGFVLLTGEVGSGKTTIIRDLINKNLDQVVLSKIFNTNVNSEQLLAMINDDFNLPVQGKDKITLLRDLNHFLVEQYAKGTQPLLIIDEAQNLSPETLEEIRMLSNLETADSKLLQIILVGQPELRRQLARPELRQLRQRISIQCHLQPLSRQEVEEYILHRLEVAGNREALRFTPRAFDVIEKYSCGIPRLINIICDFLLLAAFAEGMQDIDEEMISEIVGDLDFNNHYWATEQSGTGANSVSTATIGSKSDAFLPGERIEDLVGKMCQRLDQFEKESLAVTQATLGEFNSRLDQLKKTFSLQLDKTNSTVGELLQRIDECSLEEAVTEIEKSPTALQSGRAEEQATNQAPEGSGHVKKAGLIRRIFS